MKTFKKNKKQNSFMGRSIIMLLILVMSLISVNAVNLEHNQNNVIYDYKIASFGMSYESYVIGLDSAYNDTKQTIANYTGDRKIEIVGVNRPVYFLIENNNLNNTIYLTYINDDSTEPSTIVGKIAINQELTMQEKGTYYFKFVPSYAGENFDIMIDAPDLNSFIFWVKEEQPKEFNAIVAGFVDSFTLIIDYNVGLWKVTFYGIIFLITTTFIIGLFGGSFWILKRAKRIKEEGL